jgi:hypothetical protein
MSREPCAESRERIEHGVGDPVGRSRHILDSDRGDSASIGLWLEPSLPVRRKSVRTSTIGFFRYAYPTSQLLLESGSAPSMIATRA